MTYRGHMKNGSVVFDEPLDPPLPDGTAVSVEPAERPVPLSELVEDLISSCPDLPPDAARNKRHYLYGHAKS